jgi:5-amino-6-(5-phosphoribosylamino)uracil reductase
MSVDGYIDDTGPARLILSSEIDADRVDEVRAGCDAILVGARTVRRDNPRLLVRSPERRIRRIARGAPENPVKVTITATGNLDPAARFFTGNAARLVYCARPALATLRERLSGLAEVVDAGDAPSPALLAHDLAERGVGRVLLEGGGDLATQFLAAGQADELHLVIAPFFVGDPAAPRFALPGHYPHGPDHRMQLAEVRQLGDVVLLRYLLETPHPAGPPAVSGQHPTDRGGQAAGDLGTRRPGQLPGDPGGQAPGDLGTRRPGQHRAGPPRFPADSGGPAPDDTWSGRPGWPGAADARPPAGPGGPGADDGGGYPGWPGAAHARPPAGSADDDGVRPSAQPWPAGHVRLPADAGGSAADDIRWLRRTIDLLSADETSSPGAGAPSPGAGAPSTAAGHLVGAGGMDPDPASELSRSGGAHPERVSELPGSGGARRDPVSELPGPGGARRDPASEPPGPQAPGQPVPSAGDPPGPAIGSHPPPRTPEPAPSSPPAEPAPSSPPAGPPPSSPRAEVPPAPAPVDIPWLRRAIELSRQCAPSQTAYSVGAVIVAADGTLLATGFSREADPHDHAEEVALAKVPPGDPRLPMATLYSSLEPCGVRSSRPCPCSQLIIAAGVRRVVYAWREPPLLAPGGGGRQLRAAGAIVIEVPELAPEARQVNAHLIDPADPPGP